MGAAGDVVRARERAADGFYPEALTVQSDRDVRWHAGSGKVARDWSEFLLRIVGIMGFFGGKTQLSLAVRIRVDLDGSVVRQRV
jgi:hypothetical protein